MRKIVVSLIFVCLIALISIGKTPEKPIAIIIPSYNNEKYVKWNIRSALNQKYSNYKIFYINDASQDDTLGRVKWYINKHKDKDRVKIFSNHQNKGALYNVLYTIYNQLDDDDIVVLLDGDDALAHPYVLRDINEIYSNPDKEVWLTYGQYIEKNSGNIGFNTPMPKEVVEKNSYRSHVHIPSHLRTFYAWLFKQIELEDLLVNGEFMRMTWDMGIMIPMMEMAAERHQFVDKIQYIYNDNNPISDHRVNESLQRSIDRLVRKKTPYKTLDSKPVIQECEQTRFAIVIASYNNEKYVEENLTSALTQDYKNFYILYVDDCSSDKTLSQAKAIAKKYPDLNTTFIENKGRKLAACNYNHVIRNYTDDEDVIVILDGDDQLAHKNVLKNLNKLYADPKKALWLTYGQYANKTDGTIGFCLPFPTEITQNQMFRWWYHLPSHLRTFKSWLFKKIHEDDLKYNDQFLEMSWDVASILPMVEMANGHFQFIPEVLYIYNDENDLNDHKINMSMQRELDRYIRNKPHYNPIDYTFSTF